MAGGHSSGHVHTHELVGRRNGGSAIDVFAVGNAQHENQNPVFVDLVHDAIVADPDAA
jgi:hypothetical protein